MIETVCNISFDEPGYSSPMVVDFSQCRVATTVGAKSMRVVGELRLKVRLQQGAYYFLHQLVRPDWHIHSPLPPLPRDLRNG